jgi:hypothetical protein
MGSNHKKRFLEAEENLKNIEKRIEPFTDRQRKIAQPPPEKWIVTSELYS